MTQPVELSRHDNDGFPVRRLHVPGSEFPYRLEQYREGQTMGKDCPHQALLLTEETARALGLVKAWTNEEILELMARLEDGIHKASMNLARQWALELDREILGDEDRQ